MHEVYVITWKEKRKATEDCGKGESVAHTLIGKI